VRRDVVVVGGSAGSTQALRQMRALLRADLAASVLVATHLAPQAPSRLARHLADAGSLPAVAAADGAEMRLGTIHTAVPDRHLPASRHDVLRLTRGPRKTGAPGSGRAVPFRSAVVRTTGDRRGAVRIHRRRAAGLAAIVECGGTALVQRPASAKFDGMPRAALRSVPDALALTATQLARAITELAGKPVAPAVTGPFDALIWESDMTENAHAATSQPGRPVGLGCPECSGGMNVVENGAALHYLCHCGHSYSPETFVAASKDSVESALWTALSALPEQSVVLQEMVVTADKVGDRDTYRRHGSAIRRIDDAIEAIRMQLLDATPYRRTAEATPPDSERDASLFKR
jgi:two-component system chemotaxis response regulator CheB